MPDMTNAEAAKVLTEMVDALGENNLLRYTKAIRTALAALTAPGWIRTADRLPTEPDDTPFIAYMEGWFENPYDAIRVWTAGEIRYIPEEVIAYMPLPPLPEVDA